MTARPDISFDDLLDSVPVRNERAEAEPMGRNGLVVRVPFRKRWYMNPPLTYILPIGRARRMSLDPVGREVWEMIDGRNTTEAIIERIATRYQIGFHEARMAVTQFLQGLTRNEAVVVTIGRNKEAHA